MRIANIRRGPKASGGVPSLREVTRRDSHFVCQGCGHVALAWTGRCPGCGEWNTLVETLRTRGASRRGLGAAGGGGSVRPPGPGAAPRPVPLRDARAPAVCVGDVTKDGAVAGPRVLEHLVDCVLLFEGERERSFRTLRALKNRFGATSEVGVFEMRSGGLVEVADPSARFVGEASDAAGSCVLCAMEGTRPPLVEVQALVAQTEIVPPRRVATGIDRNRLAMVIAVLARHGRPSL